MDEFSVLADGSEWSFQLLLWQRARDSRLWAVTAAEDRPRLFDPNIPGWQIALEAEASRVAPLAGPLRVLSALARYPEVMHADDLSTACFAVSEWAVSNHLAGTAVEFAETAALVDPTSSHMAAHAGQLCAQQAADARAEIWYERGKKLGYRSEDWEWYVRSLIRLGILRYTQGRFREASRSYAKARNRARWAGLPAYAGKCHHDMLLVSLAVGSFTTGDKHARQALEYYPDSYERLPHLANDYATFLSTFGCDTEALELLDVCLPLIDKPYERIAVLGTLAKASAGLGDRVRHKAAVEDVLFLSSLSEFNAAGSLALASEGALAIREWKEAEQLASKALEMATRRREREPQRRAELVLQAAKEHRALVPPGRSDPQRAAETTAMFLAKLTDLDDQKTTDAGAHSRGRAELTNFSIAGR